MQVGYQVGQVVLRGSVDLQQQWRQYLEQFRAGCDFGFDIYSEVPPRKMLSCSYNLLF
jgi:hypothetical protein